MPDTPHPTLHAYLKEASMARHHDTESAMGEIGLATLDGYISFLRVQAAGIDALERMLAPYHADFQNAGIEWAHRRDAAIEDLSALSANWQPMPPPSLPDFDHALGAAYTLEGSRLGNAMLSRQLATDHPDLAARASRFLSYPTPSGFWRGFTEKLNAADPGRDRWQAVLAGSIIAFDTFRQSAEIELAQRNKELT